MLFGKQVEKIYRSNIYARQDNAHGIFYFSPEDFPGLQVHPYGFKAKAGHDLNGFFYHYDDPIPGRLVVFDHGLGNGHLAYLREIEMLARAGFLVYTYYHTGCMTSGGPDTQGFAQSLNDLDQCIKAMKAEPALSGRTISVMGHSWGGFSTGNIAALHPDVSHIVVLSGFISVEAIVSQFFGGIMGGYRKPIMAMDPNPEYNRHCSVDSLGNSEAKILLVYSDNDKLVGKAAHFDVLKSALSHKDNVRFLLVHNKGHNPNYTEDAVKYLGEYSSAVSKQQKKLKTEAEKKAFRDSWDWDRMTAQDEAVWTEIFETLDT